MKKWKSEMKRRKTTLFVWMHTYIQYIYSLQFEHSCTNSILQTHTYTHTHTHKHSHLHSQLVIINSHTYQCLNKRCLITEVPSELEYICDTVCISDLDKLNLTFSVLGLGLSQFFKYPTNPKKCFWLLKPSWVNPKQSSCYFFQVWAT